MNKALIILLFFLSFNLNSQTPSHFILGEQHFDGVKIYDVIQDDELNYLFATNLGIFLHDGYSYTRIESAQMLGSSVFNFRKDSNGIIYCHNLQNQVFKIIDNKIELFFTIPAKQSHHNIFLEIDLKNQVHIQTVEHTTLNSKGQTLHNHNDTYGLSKSPISFGILPNGYTISSSHQEITRDKGNKSSTSTIKLDRTKGPNNVSITNWVTLNNQVYGIDQSNMAVFKYNPNLNEFTFINFITPELKNNSLRTYVLNDQLWLAGSRNGVYLLDHNFNSLYKNQALFSNYFISDILLDAEKNILLSTFDNGVIIIPDLNSGSINLPDDEKISYLISDEDEKLIIGSNQGNLYSYSIPTSELELINSNNKKRPVEFIHYWKDNHKLLYTTNGGYNNSYWNGSQLSQTTFNEGSLKDAFFMDENTGYLAFNYGISRIDIEQSKETNKSIDNLMKRAQCVAYNEKTESLYAGLSDGLRLLKKNNTLVKVKHHGKSIFPNSICYENGLVYVGTNTKFLLIFQGDQIIKEVPLNANLKQLSFHNGTLYMLTNNGIFSCNKMGEHCIQLQNTEENSNSSINQFLILNDHLYFSNSKFINYKKLEKLNSNLAKQSIQIKGFLLNDSIVKGNTFEYGNNKYTIQFKVSTLKYRHSINYRFKLKGYNNEWQLLDYENNSVSFNGLSPGKYTFTIQSINGNIYSSPASFTFQIKSPFYQTAWFYLLITIGLLVIVVLLYSRRINKIREKNEQRLEKQRTQKDLLETELKALRSQMNPHFIFNSLNSIQDLILKEDTEASYDYIVLFAELVRNTLNYSNQEFIPIDKEINFLNIYLSLEKLRFKEEFIYEINGQNIEGIMVPSMLIQPFIENALLHGLLHKEGLKKLSIKFELTDELTCIIEDNGVGRVKSRQIQERQATGHKSFASDAIKKRLELINHQFNQNTGYVIEDIYSDNVATGTKVTIQLPFKRNY